MWRYQVQQIDWKIKDRQIIPIEERNSEKLSHIEGIDENNENKKGENLPTKKQVIKPNL
jgi:Predicted translation initiation factor 2B subunit, eIF-2B alpha/beta/delta family